MLALYENVRALLKCRRSIKMPAHYANVGALLKCQRSVKMLVLYKCRRPIQ
jgi:hypothetical protein